MIQSILDSEKYFLFQKHVINYFSREGYLTERTLGISLSFFFSFIIFSPIYNYHKRRFLWVIL